MMDDSHETFAPGARTGSAAPAAAWKRWGPLLVLHVSVLFVASAFALKWRADQARAAHDAAEARELRNCCMGPGHGQEKLAIAVPDFSLIERSGQTVTLADLEGKVWIANFIYTTCPGPCPIMTSRLAALARELPARDDLMFVSFSVDPEHDTPEILQQFAERYRANPRRWWFLTGPRDEIHALSTKGFLLALNPATQPGTDGPIVHSTRFALVGRDGKICGYYDGLDSTALARLKEEILKLLEDRPT